MDVVVVEGLELVWDDEEVVDVLDVSRTTEVFFRITWQRGVLGPTVVARCTDILLAMVPWAMLACHVSAQLGGQKAYLAFQKPFLEP